MDPITGTFLALSAFNTFTGFLGGQAEAKAAARRGRYEQQIYEMNATVAEWQAADAIARGREAEGRQRQETRGLVGAQRTSLAAQGIDIESGSAADVQADTEYLGELDRLTIRNNAARAAWGFQVDAVNLRQQGRLARMGGNAQAGAFANQSYGTLLTGATEAYRIYRTGR